VLAENWSISADQKTYTFNLRDVNFSTGNPFNAYQLWGQCYGLYYLSANSSSWWNGYQFFDMSSVDFGPATLSLMTESGLVNPSENLLSIMENASWPIYVTSPNQIVFRLSTPFPWFTGTLIAYAGLVFDTQWVLSHGGFGTPGQINSLFNLNPIPGTGPYVVTKVSNNEFVEFSKNSAYWVNSWTAEQIRSNPYVDPGHVQTVIIKVRTDDITRYSDLSTGQASMAAIDSVNWRLVSSDPQFGYAALQPNPGLVLAVAMNTQRYPTNIPAVRQAIQHAINLTEINDTVYFGSLSPWIGPEYPTLKEFYNLGNFSGYQYNVTLSKQILSDAGIDVTKLPTLQFTILAGVNQALNTAQIIQANLAQIGINVNINAVPISEFLSAPPVAGAVSYSSALATADQNSHLTWLGTATWGMSSITPVDILLQIVNENAPCLNYATYSNPVVQTCIDSFFSTANTTQQQSLMLQAQQQINSDAPYIWLGTPTLPLADGSIVYDKAIISSFLLDPLYTGQTDTAIFNTITLVSNNTNVLSENGITLFVLGIFLLVLTSLSVFSSCDLTGFISKHTYMHKYVCTACFRKKQHKNLNFNKKRVNIFSFSLRSKIA
jgi:ABC-type transport system substrate-binding protein